MSWRKLSSAWRVESLERRILLNGFIDIDIVQPAALDQPRINVLLRRTADGDPLIADIFGFETFSIQAFYDTGASGVLLSNETADFLGVVRQLHDSELVVFEDVGVGGASQFNVSEELFISMAPFHPNTDVDNLATFNDVYTQTLGPMRMQIGPVPGPIDPLLQNLDVFGMPAMAGKVVVMDPKPVDVVAITGDFLDADTMRTYVYDPGTAFNESTADSDPGIPAVDRHVQLSYSSFDRFTQVLPAGATGPTLRNNPFIGPNPVLALDDPPGVDTTPPITIRRGASSDSGSWLLDTGAAASLLSQGEAANVGVFYADGTYQSDDPVLVDALGNPLPDQFTLTIGGIGGTFKAAGFFLDSLEIPTMEGDVIRFFNAPVLVVDISVQDPITLQTLTLDGIFGMNFLVATAFVTEALPIPIISDLTVGPFNWIVFDEPNGLLGLDLKQDVTPPPPPTNTAPEANEDDFDVDEDMTLVGDVLLNDDDADDDTLSAVLVGSPSHGDLTLDPNGSFSYTPHADFHGSDSFTYMANDGTADSNVATVNITVHPVNDAPVAEDDDYETDEDNELIISLSSVLDNDGDVDGDKLSAVLVDGPSNGELIFNSDGTFTYSPDPDFHGSDSFTYLANDGIADSNVATVNITVHSVNDLPVAVDDLFGTTEDMPLNVPAPGVLGNDTDIDGELVSVSIVTGPNFGELTLNADGSFTYTPDPEFSGMDSFTYLVSDPLADGNTATAWINVQAVNDAPVGLPDEYVTTKNRRVADRAPGVLANDSDAESSNDLLVALLHTAAANGTVRLRGDGAFAYRPNRHFVGTDSFMYIVRDPAGAESEPVLVTIQVMDSTKGRPLDPMLPGAAPFNGVTPIADDDEPIWN